MITEKTCLFEGEEAEGQFIGLHTLFVCGDVPYEKIRECIDKQTYGQIYFGAGKSWSINYETVKKVLSKQLAPIIMLETPRQIPLEMFEDHRVFAMLPPPAQINLFAYYWKFRPKIQVRVEIGHDDFYVFPLSSAKRNSYFDYNEDLLIWSE